MTQSGLSDQYVESQSADLQSRVQQATLGAAQNISSEDPSTANHAARNVLATAVSRNPQAYTQPFCSLLCSQGIKRTSTDAEISVMVAATWNTMAGITP